MVPCNSVVWRVVWRAEELLLYSLSMTHGAVFMTVHTCQVCHDCHGPVYFCVTLSGGHLPLREGGDNELLHTVWCPGLPSLQNSTEGLALGIVWEGSLGGCPLHI